MVLRRDKDELLKEPTMTPFLTEYFARTGWQQPVSVDIETLRALHLQTQTVSVFIWRQFEQGSVGQGMAMATLTLLTGLVLMLTALGIMQRTTRG